MAINFQNLINALKNNIIVKRKDSAITNILKKSSILTGDQYKTIIDTLVSLEKKVRSDNGMLSLPDKIENLIGISGTAATIDKSRANRYKTYDMMVDRIPIMKEGLKIYTANILSPDDITKLAFKFETKQKTIAELPDFKIVVEQFRNIVEETNGEKLLDEVIYNTLKYGDYFVEISVASERLKRVLDKKQIPFSGKNSITLEYHEYVVDPSVSNTVITETHGYPLKEIELRIHRPHTVIALQTRSLLLGYLIVESTEEMEQEKERFNTEFNIGQIITTLASDITAFLRKYKNVNIDEPYIKKHLAAVLELDQKINFSSISVRYIPPDKMVHFKLNQSKYFPYGESWLSGLELDARLYLTDKIATVVHKVARAGERRVAYVEVGVDPDVEKYINSAKNQLIKKEVAWTETDIDALPSAITPFETLYIPRRNGQAFFELETLQTGAPASEKIESNKELKNSIINGLGIPPGLLGYPDWGENNNTLSQMNITFARLIIGLQKAFSEQFTELFSKIYEIAYTGTPEYSALYKYINLTFNPPQNILLESISNSYTSIANIAQTLAQFGVPQLMIAKKFMPEIDWDEIEKIKAQSEKPNEEEEMGGAKF